MHRRYTGPSKAPSYKGNGKFVTVAGPGCIFPRSLTEEEQRAEILLRRKYYGIVSDFKLMVGTNMGKPIWVIRTEDGRECESYEGLEPLVKEFTEWVTEQIRLSA